MKNDEPMRNINPFGLRLQPHLRSKLEDAAEASKRSLNAEISARLEESFQDDTPVVTGLVPANKARKIAAEARKQLAVSVRQKIIDDLNKAIAQGMNSVSVDLDHFPLFAEEDASAEEIIRPIEQELRDAGYLTDLDGPGTIVVYISGE